MKAWGDPQFWKDSTWRAFRTFCQTLAGLLAAVQTSLLVPSMPVISIPWYGYLYASAVAGLVSLLQSVDRERVAISVSAATAPVVPEVAYAEPDYPPTEPLRWEADPYKAPVPEVTPISAPQGVALFCGDTPRT